MKNRLETQIGESRRRARMTHQFGAREQGRAARLRQLISGRTVAWKLSGKATAAQ